MKQDTFIQLLAYACSNFIKKDLNRLSYELIIQLANISDQSFIFPIDAFISKNETFYNNLKINMPKSPVELVLRNLSPTKKKPDTDCEELFKFYDSIIEEQNK